MSKLKSLLSRISVSSVAWLSIAFLLAVCAACAPVTGPPGAENDLPTINGHDFLTRDGLKLPFREWEANNPRAIVLAVHGMGDYSGDFDQPATWWAAHGITVIAYDQRGFGKAPNPGLWPGTRALTADFDDFADALRRKYPNIPLYALGESMGAAVIVTALAKERRPDIDGAILAAPAVWSRAEMPGYDSIILWLGAHFIPWYRFSGSDLNAKPTDNTPMLRAASKDPLNQHETRADAIWGLVHLMEEARASAYQLHNPPPMLIVYGAKDFIIPATSTNAFLSAVGPHAVKRQYPNGYHMILRDLSAEIVWKDIETWIDNAEDRETQAEGHKRSSERRP